MPKLHEHWASRLGFIMATSGSAVGLGSLWRFPYIAGENGGGAFVLLYVLFTFCIGLPVFIGELIIGRKTQKSAILAYSELTNQSRTWRSLGWLNLSISLITLSYYSVVSGWCLSYALMSLTQFSAGKSSEEIKQIFFLLRSSPGINVLWSSIFLLINVGVIVGGIQKGIEYWSKILMPCLWFILMSLFFYSLSLPGFPGACHFIFSPDFSQLSSDGILSALGMAFFTLSVSLGVIITYGSYMQQEDNIPVNAFIITILTTLVSLIAALVIFPAVFTFGLPPQGGPGLIFQTLPIVFAKLPGTIFISTIFFLLLLFAALTSTISLLEMLVANLIELYEFSRKRAIAICITLAWIVGLPSMLSGSGVMFAEWEKIYSKNFFDTVSFLTANWLMPISAFCLTFLIGWRANRNVIIEEFNQGVGYSFVSSMWFFIIRWISPFVLFIILLQELGILRFKK